MKKSNLYILLFSALLLGCSSHNEATRVEQEKPQKKEKVYHNPIINTSLPDPTVIRASDGKFYLYATEDIRNTPIYRSGDLVHWAYLGTAFTNSSRPKLVKGGGIWAPDINYINGQYVLYYAMSTWGGEWQAGIGAAVADRPEGPFKDCGKVLTSLGIGVQNSIDGYCFTENGRHYLFWGSFHGIYAIELSADGLSVLPGAERKKVAGSFMEAVCIHRRGDYYYMFGSFGSCCDGANSTYRITVGRSEHLFGPYVNKQGKQLLDNQYEVVLHANNQFVGTGHNAEIITDDYGDDWMIYHSFLRSDIGRGRVLMMDQLKWKDGWPYVDTDSPSKEHNRPYFK